MDFDTFKAARLRLVKMIVGVWASDEVSARDLAEQAGDSFRLSDDAMMCGNPRASVVDVSTILPEFQPPHGTLFRARASAESALAAHHSAYLGIESEPASEDIGNALQQCATIRGLMPASGEFSMLRDTLAALEARLVRAQKKARILEDRRT